MNGAPQHKKTAIRLETSLFIGCIQVLYWELLLTPFSDWLYSLNSDLIYWCRYDLKSKTITMTRFLINNYWALGDAICMTALVRDFFRQYGTGHSIRVGGNFQKIWDHNPYVESQRSENHTLSAGDEVTVYLDYRHELDASRRGKKRHFLAAYYQCFERETGIRVDMEYPFPDLHLNADELRPPRDYKYWVIVAGGKTDIPIKWWAATKWQNVVDGLLDHGIRVIQLGSERPQHHHFELSGVENLVGHTNDLRDFIRMIYHSDGVICGVTAAMHIAAAFQKPCVVVAGGREEPWWEAYVNHYDAFPCTRKIELEHRYLHAVGELPCCENRGCWKTHIHPVVSKKPIGDSRVCSITAILGEETIPQCMNLITPERVVEAATRYQKH